ncbi:hypothetical protein [Opitutus sp. ER46]|uniref:hypothetical protein n=1 Tax=Opitutus sp. ER46 TaxID=2161864 RepID=UPI000D30C220|nr:hypothetical protein [Opitutus sp. ER46]PTX95678.1 hypothetical protein DB354_09705 [Opitutus sp. ER46]
MKVLFVLLAAAVGLCAGCTTVTMRKHPTVDLTRYQRVFVVQPFNENNHVDEFLAAEIRQTGRTASSGPLTMMPEDAEAVLSYSARWTWDFNAYIIELNAELHTAHTKKKLAEVRFYQPSARTAPPSVIAHAVIQKLFGSSGLANAKPEK